MNHVKMIKKLSHLRWVCRGIVVAQTLLSVWANQLNAEHNFPSIFISVLPPAFVLGGFELVSRIPIPKHRSWLTRSIRPIATAGITVGSAWLSYFHQKEAFSLYSKDQTTVIILPILIDGLMIVAAVSLIELNEQIKDLELRQVGLEVRIAKPAGKKSTKELSGKERIAKILHDAPDLTIRQIADKASVSYNYAHSIVTELRKEPVTP